MKLRDAIYVTGGYVVRNNKVLLVWHPNLTRWVPAGGQLQVASGEYPHEGVVREVLEETGLTVEVVGSRTGEMRDNAVSPLPLPVAIQEISVGTELKYLDFVYFCRVVNDKDVSLDYVEARAYKWFNQADLYRFPLYPHVRHYAERALHDVSAST